ncbi:MAG: alpha/beta hydrolase [Dysgonamonadaceae bacterium]
MKKISFLFIYICFFLSWGFAQNFLSDSLTLHTQTGDIYGTLLLPSSDHPLPVALIIGGSGPTDRDGNQPTMKNNSLKMLAEALAKKGIASLRFDKRGIACSKAAMKEESDIRFENYISDVRDWVNLLSQDKRFSSVSMIGHSEGALIGMIASGSNTQVAKFVSIAGAGVPMDEILKRQLSKLLENQPEVMKQKIFSYIDSLKQGKVISFVEPTLYTLFRPSVQPYLISIFRYNPQDEIRKLQIPVLIIQGSTDIQVQVADADLLATANPKAREIIIENMNHVLKNCSSKEIVGQTPIYMNPELPINSQLIDEIANFLK